MRRAIDSALRRAHSQKKADPSGSIDNLFSGSSGLPEIAGVQLDRATLAAGIQHHGALVVRSLYSSAQVERLLAHTKAEQKASRLPLGCSPAVLQALPDVYQQCGLLKAVREYLDGEPLLFGEHAKFRHHHSSRDRKAVITWHQDAAFFGPGCCGVNYWTAITPCGEDNPGLAFIPRLLEHSRTDCHHQLVFQSFRLPKLGHTPGGLTDPGRFTGIDRPTH